MLATKASVSSCSAEARERIILVPEDRSSQNPS